MRISRVQTTVRDTAAAAEFFRQTLGLLVVEQPGRAAIDVGSSRLDLDEDPFAAGDLHLAFLIPVASFALAKRWLASRVRLLTEDGLDEFEASPSWNSRSLYFEAPDGTVLELIARRDLQAPPSDNVGPADLLSISEVGLVVPDVAAVVQTLHDEAGLDLYGQDRPGEHFAPVGSIDGLLILVTEGRIWFPTTSRTAHPRALIVEGTGGHPGDYRLTKHSHLVITS